MAAQNPPKSTGRARILDAAAKVMRRDGLVHATTKQIAREAQCSEALLYKHFPDEQDLFLSVLAERSAVLEIDAHAAGTKTVRENLVQMTTTLLTFYRENFPMAASIFGSHELLASHRDAMAQRGVGPWAPRTAVRDYLEAEARLGRLDPAVVDLDAVATMLTGAALYEGFVAAYADTPLTHVRGKATALVAALDLGPSA